MINNRDDIRNYEVTQDVEVLNIKKGQKMIFQNSTDSTKVYFQYENGYKDFKNFFSVDFVESRSEVFKRI